MPKCSFCGKQYEIPRGLTYVKADGKIFYYCSSKCRKNHELGRVAKRVKWIKKKKKAKTQISGKEHEMGQAEEVKKAKEIKEKE